MNNKKIFFEYHCWESPDSIDAILWKHSKQYVKIIRKLTKNECDITEVGQMYRVKFDDGLEYDVFEDELYLENNNETYIESIQSI